MHEIVAATAGPVLLSYLASRTDELQTAEAPPIAWAELLEAARDGDDLALGQICQRFRQHLLLTADDGLGNDLRGKVGASDVVQDSALDVLNDFCHFAGESEQEFRRWITRLVERNLIDSARQFRHTKQRDVSRETSIEQNAGFRDHTTLVLADRHETTSELVRRRENDEALTEAVNGLSSSQKQVVLLRHRHGLSYAEIASQLNRNEASVRKLWSRAIEQLRNILASADE